MRIEYQVLEFLYLVFPACLVFCSENTLRIRKNKEFQIRFKEEMSRRSEFLFDFISDLGDDEMKYSAEDFARIQELSEVMETIGLLYFHYVAKIFSSLNSATKDDYFFKENLSKGLHRILSGLEKYPVVEKNIHSYLNIVETVVMNSTEDISSEFYPRINALKQRNAFLKTKTT